MDLPTYIKEAIDIVRFALETSRSVDGFIIKLESAVSHILQYGREEDVNIFFDILVEEGLLNKLACNKDELDIVLSSPRHSLMRRYSKILYEALDKSICVGGFKHIIPPPSHAAGQIAWGSEYRDKPSKSITHKLSLKRVAKTHRLKKIIALSTILLIILLILYSAYNAFINL